MYYATDRLPDGRQIVFGWPTKSERDKAMSGPYPTSWKPVSATEAKKIAVNADRISLLGIAERPTWLKTALYRYWPTKRYSNGITIERPKPVPVFLSH